MVNARRLRPRVYIGRTLVPPEHGQAKVCMLNTTRTPQLIVRGTCLGDLQPAHIYEEAITASS